MTDLPLVVAALQSLAPGVKIEPKVVPEQARRYSIETEHNGIQMRLVGHWIDLAAYYLGSDGNLWAWQSGWSNCGPIADNPHKRKRGQFWGL